MKILVTGGSGLVGSALKEIMPEAIYVSGNDYDLTYERYVIEMFDKIKPDWVIHLAALNGGLLHIKDHPAWYLEDNILMNTWMLKCARLHEVKRFTGFLSPGVYGDDIPAPLKEKDIERSLPGKATYPYGIAKKVMRDMIEYYNFQYGTRYNYIIPSNIYGKNMGERTHFISDVIRKFKNDEEVVLYGTGKAVRQFIYAGDVAKVIKLMIERDITASFNVSHPFARFIYEWVNYIQTLLKKENTIVNYNSNYPNGQINKNMDLTIFNQLFPGFEFTELKDVIHEI